MPHYAMHLLTLVVATSLGISAAAKAATPERVDAVVAKGVANLYTKIANGNAEKTAAPDPAGNRALSSGGTWGGHTSMIVLALLVAGENPSEPKLAAAIKWLEEHNFAGTYATSLRAQVWTHLDY